MKPNIRNHINHAFKVRNKNGNCMRYHAAVHDDKNEIIFECHVFADNTGSAREIVKKHLQKNNLSAQSKMNISLIEVRIDIKTKHLIVE